MGLRWLRSGGCPGLYECDDAEHDNWGGGCGSDFLRVLSYLRAVRKRVGSLLGFQLIRSAGQWRFFAFKHARRGGGHHDCNRHCARWPQLVRTVGRHNCEVLGFEQLLSAWQRWHVELKCACCSAGCVGRAVYFSRHVSSVCVVGGSHSDVLGHDVCDRSHAVTLDYSGAAGY